jgi:hypothetical protein
MTNTRITLLVLAVLTAGVLTRPLLAQSSERVRVALVDSLSAPELRAEIVRFGDPDKASIVLLRRGDVRAEDLTAALVTLRERRAQRPNRSGVVSRISVTGYADLSRVPPAARQRAERMLSEVRAAPLSRIGNLGRGHWAEFELQH